MGTRAQLKYRIATHHHYADTTVDGVGVYRLGRFELWRACARRGLRCPVVLGLSEAGVDRCELVLAMDKAHRLLGEHVAREGCQAREAGGSGRSVWIRRERVYLVRVPGRSRAAPSSSESLRSIVASA